MSNPISMVNDFGQVINPGDKVIWTSQGGYSKRVKQGIGTYLGITPGGYASVQVPAKVWVYLYADGTEGRSWRGQSKYLRQEDAFAIRTLYMRRIVKFAE